MAFLPQQWLHERASMLRNACIAGLVHKLIITVARIKSFIVLRQELAKIATFVYRFQPD